MREPSGYGAAAYNSVALRYLSPPIPVGERMARAGGPQAALMNRRSTVSVVIPTLDRPRLLEAAVESVLLQTYPIDQIVVVDDGSSPKHAAHLETFAAAHPVIELHRHPKTLGVSSARNLGLQHARGDYLLFLDDDDLIHPRLCEDGLAVIRDRDADAVVFLYECIFTPTGLADTYPVSLLFDYRSLNGHPVGKLAGCNPAPPWFLDTRPTSCFLRYLIPIHSCLVRRAKIGDGRFPESLTQGEDTYFWIALATRGCRFVSDPRVYAYVRRHSANTTRSRSRYAREIQSCYEALIADGLLREPRDLFLAHLKLFWFKLSSRRRGWASHLRRILAAPNLLARELGFWIANFRARRRLVDYYFSR